MQYDDKQLKYQFGLLLVYCSGESQFHLYFSVTWKGRIQSAWNVLGLSMDTLTEVTESINTDQDEAYEVSVIEVTETTEFQSVASCTRLTFDRIVVEEDMEVVSTAYKETILEVFSTIESTACEWF